MQGYLEAEKAQILYNHLRMGDQPTSFRTAIKPFLPALATRGDFLTETARRLGTRFFASDVKPEKVSLDRFFERPESFLVDTISGLSDETQAALAVIYLSGGVIASPVPEGGILAEVTSIFGVSALQIRDALNSLNGSLTLLAHNEQGRYWTYKHPTVGDAFSTYVSRNPEFLDLFLRGAKPETLMREIVCGSVELAGASVRVLPSHYLALLGRLSKADQFALKNFLSYRSDTAFASQLIAARPDLSNGLRSFFTPIALDSDASLLVRLHQLGILPPDFRAGFLVALKNAAVEEADASFLEDEGISDLLLDGERAEILEAVKEQVLGDLPAHIARVRSKWEREYPPDDHFDEFKGAIKEMAKTALTAEEARALLLQMEGRISDAVGDMMQDYESPPSVNSPLTSGVAAASPLEGLFRDVDM